MQEIIQQAINKGAKLYASLSGGKDGQAMLTTLIKNNLPVTGTVHADLGSVEWPQSLKMCGSISAYYDVPFHIVRRKDGMGLLEYWKRRMKKLKGTGKPFWSSSKARYCTSDLKRDPINNFFIGTKHNFIISCEGIRAQESKARAKKCPLTIRPKVSSSYYKGMTVEQAIAAYTPGKRLVLTWYAIFNYSEEEVWGTQNMTRAILIVARTEYKKTGKVPKWWPFHPAYVFGNERVSCVFCVLASLNDLTVGAEHRPELLAEMLDMQEEGNATFKHGFSLTELIK